MFQNLFLTHKIAVIVFLLIYVIKTTLLLINKNAALEQFKKMTKVIEMIVSVTFLATGIYLITQIPEIKSLLIVKLVAVALAIPVAIIGFKKNNKMLATLSLVLIIGAYGLAEMSKKQGMSKPKEDVKETTIGPAKTDTTKTNADTATSVDKEAAKTAEFNAMRAKKLYGDYCSSCHGADGKAKRAGAADLSKSTLGAMEAKAVVTDGKASMPGVGETLNSGEINAVVNYIQSFKEKK